MSKVNKFKEENMSAIRQGETLLIPTNKRFKGEKVKQYIVGHSETGHHHVLESKTGFDVFEDDVKDLYLRLFEPAKLSHKKSVNRHKDLTVPAGTYKVAHKQEYDPFQKVMRRVFD